MFIEIIRIIAKRLIDTLLQVSQGFIAGVAAGIATGITRRALEWWALAVADGTAEERDIAFDDLMLEVVHVNNIELSWNNRMALRMALAIS